MPKVKGNEVEGAGAVVLGASNENGALPPEVEDDAAGTENNELDLRVSLSALAFAFASLSQNGFSLSMVG